MDTVGIVELFLLSFFMPWSWPIWQLFFVPFMPAIILAIIYNDRGWRKGYREASRQFAPPF